ncbi:A disintegrin and metalloproteinase with thrombospondin motifs 6-like [Physella acuta]|uniref:A disintegrin and metalloproteinase with thrombospondin motifs 6-like n=1 Tax=Physella acuta TaxID=109671 RepID=UPI0027DB8706|nr:A disintegrin and metalloproteinase with thrombospondin motifs 6-like [Physella acuta]
MIYRLPCVLFVILSVSIGKGQPVEVSYSSQDVEGQILPDLVNVTLTTDTNTSHLQLSRVEHIHLDIPLYSLSVDSNGTFSQRRESSRHRKNVGYYQDAKTQAVFQLTRTNSVRERTSKLSIMGEFKQNNQKYFLKPEVTSTDQATTTTSSPLASVVYTIKRSKKQPSNLMDYAIPPPESPLKRRRYNQPSNVTWDHSPPPKRGRRGVDSTYYIDVIAVIDFAAYNLFYQRYYNRTKAMEDIHEYYAYTFSAIDLLYQGITSVPYKIRVRLNKIFVAETSSSSNFTTDYATQRMLDADDSLGAFNSFAGKSDLLHAYDHAMLFTGFNLSTKDSGPNVVGYAYIGGMCRTDGSSTSIIEDMADYQASNTAAHELGHSLSAQHDGDKNECSGIFRYIMAASVLSKETPATAYNPWQFSSCSIQYFTSFIEEQLKTIRGYYCLTKAIPIEQDIPYAGDQFPGQVYSPDQQCQMVYGSGSFFCRNLYVNNTESICHQTYCADPEDTDTCYVSGNIFAVRGTTCGNGKICVNGHCVAHVKAPQADETCLYGDQPGQFGNFSSCQAFVDDFIGYCYRDDLRAACCASCIAVRKNIQDCENDDYYSDCEVSSCLNATLKTQCCKTCNVGVPYTTQTTKMTPKTTAAKICVDDPTFTYRDGQCESLVQNYPSMCDEVEVKRACCVSCQKVNTTADACLDDTEYRYNGQTCSSAVRKSRALCKDWDFERICCKSCLNVSWGSKLQVPVLLALMITSLAVCVLIQ